jgi:hypothetical protein
VNPANNGLINVYLTQPGKARGERGEGGGGERGMGNGSREGETVTGTGGKFERGRVEGDEDRGERKRRGREQRGRRQRRGKGGGYSIFISAVCCRVDDLFTGLLLYGHRSLKI